MFRTTALSLLLLAATPAWAQIKLGSGQLTGGPARNQLSETAGVPLPTMPPRADRLVAGSRAGGPANYQRRSDGAPLPTMPPRADRLVSGSRAGGPANYQRRAGDGF